MKKVLMAFALLGLLFLSGCNPTRITESIDFKDYEENAIVMGDDKVANIINNCLKEKGVLIIEHKLFTNVYSCQIDLTREE